MHPINIPSYHRGFTLIELLVVIAIIGVLSSVVLASLNTARAKAADASVKSNLANSRAQAELIYDRFGCYSSDTATACNIGAVYNGACPTTIGAGGTGMIFGNPVLSAQIIAAKNAS